MSKKKQEHSYLPTSVELNTAIGDILSKDENAEAKQVRSLLLKNHKNWKVPERRVAKFVKRQKRGNASVTSSDDDDVSVSSVASRTKQIAKSVAKGAVSPFRKIGNKASGMWRKKKNGDGLLSTPPPPSDMPPVQLLNVGPSASQDETDEVDFLAVPDISAPTPSKVEAPVPKAAAPSKSETDKAPAATSKIEVQEKALAAYVDDNDGKKESGPCTPCEGCMIL